MYKVCLNLIDLRMFIFVFFIVIVVFFTIRQVLLKEIKKLTKQYEKKPKDNRLRKKRYLSISFKERVEMILIIYLLMEIIFIIVYIFSIIMP